MSYGDNLDGAVAETIYQAKGKSGKNVTAGIFGKRWPSFRGVDDAPECALEFSDKSSGGKWVSLSIPISGSFGFGQGCRMEINLPLSHQFP
jgi:hypothetical protein